MSSIASISVEQILKIQDNLKISFESCKLYERAAQIFAESIFNEGKPHVVLSRVYLSVPYGQLPVKNKTFVDKLANSKGITNLINEKTPVLSLVGTAGKQSAWMDRHTSQGHVGIPLCSAEFVDAIPMMSRLLQELGFNLSWFDKQDLSIVEKSTIGTSGLFFVSNANQGKDNKGRYIIAAQDFVKANHVCSVFGMGSVYMGGNFVVSIVFTDEQLTKDQIKHFTPLINILKTSTLNFISKNALLGD